MSYPGTLPLYADLLEIMKEVAQLKTRLSTKPTERDVKNYKLLIKCFEAFTRIKQHPEIEMDTIGSVNVGGVKEKERKDAGGLDCKAVAYMFGDSPGDGPKVEAVSGGKSENKGEGTDDSDIDPSDLFLTKAAEPLPDDNEVKEMLKKSEYQLQRAIKNRNYLITVEVEGSDSDQSSDGGDSKIEKKVADVPIVVAPVVPEPSAPVEPLDGDKIVTPLVDISLADMVSLPQRTRRNAITEIPNPERESMARFHMPIDAEDDDDDDDSNIYHTTRSASYNASQKDTPGYGSWNCDQFY